MYDESSFGYGKLELDTPALLLDLDLFESNLKTMEEAVHAAGKKLRPHAKTHKCSQIAKIQLDRGAVGICAAKVSEAEALINAGIGKVLITSPVVSSRKIACLLDCAAAAPELMVVADNFANVAELNTAAASRHLKLPVLVDVDPEMGRTGVSFSQALKLGNFIAGQPNLELKGIQCYAGQVQHVTDYAKRREDSLNLMRQAAEVVRLFRREGLNCGIFTGTGTGTFSIDSQIHEITDLQVGSYCVMDAEYSRIGSAGNALHFDLFKPALSLLTSVISVNQPNFVTVDAGLKSLYYVPHAPPQILRPVGEGWQYQWFGDEHGRIYFPSPGVKPALKDTIELSASHCDPTINLYECIYTTRNNIVTGCWKIDLRGLSR